MMDQTLWNSEVPRAKVLWLAVVCFLILFGVGGSSLSGAQEEKASKSAITSERMEDHPGYFPIETFGVDAFGEPRVEINLPASLLKLVGSFAGSEQPDFGELVSGLIGVRVRVFELAPEAGDRNQGRVKTMSKWLDDNGWDTIIKVTDEQDQVYIYSRTLNGNFVGVSVVAQDEMELTVVNLVGSIDLDQLSRVAGALDLDLDLPIPTRSSKSSNSGDNP